MTTLASYDKAGYTHLYALATRYVAMASATDVAAAQCWSQKVSNVLIQDFWGSCSHESAMESLHAVQAWKAKGKVPVEALAEGPEVG